MHVIFIPYGKRDQVELMLRDMEAQKHKLIMHKGEEEAYIWIQGHVRKLPLGVMEYAFPKEDLDRVLTTLNFDQPAPYNLGKTTLAFLRRLFRAKKVKGPFDTSEKYLWIKRYVSIIPIGIREDKDVIGIEADDLGWTHEGI